MQVMFNGDDIVENNKFSDIIKPQFFTYGLIPGIVISFTSANWNGKPESYSDDTNNNQPVELLSRISYLIREYKSKHRINIYIVGNDKGDDRRLRTYEYLFKNLFSSEYKIFKDKFMNYKKYAMFFISKQILK